MELKSFEASKKITDNTKSDFSPLIDGNNIVWLGDHDNNFNSEAYLYNGNSSRQLSLNVTSVYDISIDGNQLAFSGYNGSDSEIFVYNLDTNIRQQITINAESDINPSIDNDKVVWSGYDGDDYEIFVYDLNTNTSRKITDNTESDSNPSISGDLIVWKGHDGDDYEIFVHDLNTNTSHQITDNTESDSNPSISGDLIVWEGYDGNDYEIFSATISDATETEETTNTNNQAISSEKISTFGEPLLGKLDINDDSYSYDNNDYYYDFYSTPDNNLISSGADFNKINITVTSSDFEPMLMFLDSQEEVMKSSSKEKIKENSDGIMSVELFYAVGTNEPAYISVESVNDSIFGSYEIEAVPLNIVDSGIEF